MKVLHVCTVDEGGAALCCLRLHESLIKQGVESKVLFKKKTTDIPGVYRYKENFKEGLLRSFSKCLRILGLKITERNKVFFLSKKMNKAYTLPVSGCDISRSEFANWADVIHLHWIDDYVDQPTFFKKITKPVVWTLHDENMFCGIAHYTKDIIQGNPIEIKYSELKSKIYQDSSNLSIVFLSEYMKSVFGQHPYLKGKRQFIINNAVDTSKFLPQRKEFVRRKYRIADNKTVVLFIANDINDPRKGLDVLIRALKEINNKDWLVLAIGNNKKINENLELVRPVGLIESVSELNNLICCGNFFAMPSYQEAFPQSPMEAMACGLPVVAFPVSGTKELINNNNGVVCEDFTKDSLKAGILKLLSRQYDANTIRQDMIDRFSPEMIARKYIDLYNELIDQQ